MLYRLQYHFRPSRTLVSALAVVLLVAVLLGPLTAITHHHCNRSLAADGENCPVCLWQHFFAAEIPCGPALDVSTVARLESAPTPCDGPALDLPPSGARAPPSASC
jgi:hypothetical protein